MENKKDVLYIIATVILMAVIGLYLAFSHDQSINSVISIPFKTNKNSKTIENNNLEDELKVPTQAVSENEAVIQMAIFDTNIGVFEVKLAKESAPNSVKSFEFLVNNGYYNDTKFHRYVPGLLIQGGSRNTLTPDLEDDRFGGPGYVIEDEINWESLGLSDEKKKSLEEEGYKNTEGLKSIPMDKYVVAWANSGPDTNGSQFFIVLGSRSEQRVQDLEGHYTVFGEVVSGKNVIDKISNMDVSLDSLDEPRPSSEIVIRSIKIEQR